MAALQELLNVGLVDVGSDDTRFEKLQLAVSDLEKVLAEEPELLVTATLIALDEDVSEDEPLLVRTEALLIKHWRTMRNTHANRPRQLLRAILVEAIERRVDESPEAAGVVWYTSVSPIKHGQTKVGKGAEVIHQLVQESFERAEAEALSRTQVATKKTRRRKKKSLTPEELDLDITQKGISSDDVISSVGRALGPNLPGHELSDPTPQWPNSGQQWSHESAPRLADALVEAVNLGTSTLSSSIESELKRILGEVVKQVSEVMQEAERKQSELSASSDASELRLSVLWWAKALYSPMLGKGYRASDPGEFTLASVLDLNELLPVLPPNSVGYVLGQVIRTLTAGEESLTLLDYVRELSQYVDQFKEFFEQTFFEGKRPLLSLILDWNGDESEIADRLSLLSGLNPKLVLSREDLALWIFRDIQAQRLVKELT